jgi:hypothetical protein
MAGRGIFLDLESHFNWYTLVVSGSVSVALLLLG